MLLLSLLCTFCFDKDLGRRLSFSALLSLSLGGVIKDALRFRRPIGVEGIRSVNPQSVAADYAPDGYPYSYSMPSSHTQAAATAWSVLALYYKRLPVALVGLAATLLVGLSRVYLGLHYPADVLAGMGLGFAVALLSTLCTHYLWDVKWLYALCGLGLIGSFYLSPPSSDTLKGVAALCGLVAGCALDDCWVNFRPSHRASQSYLTLAGTALVWAIVYLPLKRLLPADPAFDFLRYFVLLFTISGPYPALVMHLRYRAWDKKQGGA